MHRHAGQSVVHERQRAGTIKFWHGWSQPHEVAAIQANIKAFEKLHPNITVVSTPNVTDDKLLQGIRSGSGTGRRVVVHDGQRGAFCNGALTDLNPLLQKAGIDKNKVFVKTMIDYTQYKGKQCTLPLLGDARACTTTRTCSPRRGSPRRRRPGRSSRRTR